MKVAIAIILAECPIPFLSGRSWVLDLPWQPSPGGILGAILEQEIKELDGKEVDGLLHVGVVNGTITERLTLSDDLPIIPHVFEPLTKAQSVHPILVKLMGAIEPNGVDIELRAKFFVDSTPPEVVTWTALPAAKSPIGVPDGSAPEMVGAEAAIGEQAEATLTGGGNANGEQLPTEGAPAPAQ